MNAIEIGIYVIAAHPAWRESPVNRPLRQAATALPRVQVQDLYSSYPDYTIDVAAEQAALVKAQLVVLLHPIQGYRMPALQHCGLMRYSPMAGLASSTTDPVNAWATAHRMRCSLTCP